ncbi:MAG: type I DNA topoisomerase [Lachnospiraceae bacterium]|jgi:DNA topoisomerase-1|nr:type I DNA topoisomerase [Lachnospiraceae bacterium]
MSHNLVIVESPAKVKTIKKFLGSNYTVSASQGHVRDLPKSRLGIDIDDDYEPKYITIRGKGELLAGLRKDVKKSDHVYLATDPDREGEAISWHLIHALNIDEKKASRISFNEITKDAVKASLKQPREIDMDLVNAQQARRVLDRIVGYRISPLLWAKVKRGLSAGRVQSVALRIIADREKEIDDFIPEEYWDITAILSQGKGKKEFEAKFIGNSKKKITIRSEKEAQNIEKELKDKDFVITEVKTGERQKKAPLPFTTSTLQQEASKGLNFSTVKTMRIAQQLYEGVDIKGNGTIGLITYLRTDSTRISDEADKSARAYISKVYGAEYVGTAITNKDSKKKIQDAHEAIRPSDIARTPASLKDSLTRDQFRLYQLIWKRFAASRMKDAKYETISAKVTAGDYIFAANTSRLTFDGFRAVYIEAEEEQTEKQDSLKNLKSGDKLLKSDLKKEQHFTMPPAHYTEATLVKTMEDLGIGRPSTYAPTISTLLGRHYISKEGKNIFITELGDVVNNMMTTSFPSIVDVNFTANMESLLDGVEEGEVRWKTIIENFYPDIDEAVKTAEKDLESVKIADEETDVVCDLCGRNMVIKYGPHGKFLACPGFPECRNTKPYLEKAGVACPNCGKDLILRKTKKGRKYYGCEDQENCKFMSWQKPLNEKCPKCGGYLIQRGKYAACNDPACGFKKEAENNDN